MVANALTVKPSGDRDVVMVAGDISEQATADEIMRQAMDRFGRVDTLVNNAGVFLGKSFTDYTALDYALVTGVNLAGFFWLPQRVIGQMLKQHGGHVVNLSASIADFVDSLNPIALAGLTKGGLAAMTRSLAIEHASRGIRVNAVAPGIIQTPVHPPESYTPEALQGKLPPHGRVGQVSDIVYLEPASFVKRAGPAHRRRPGPSATEVRDASSY